MLYTMTIDNVLAEVTAALKERSGRVAIDHYVQMVHKIATGFISPSTRLTDEEALLIIHRCEGVGHEELRMKVAEQIHLLRDMKSAAGPSPEKKALITANQMIEELPPRIARCVNEIVLNLEITARLRELYDEIENLINSISPDVQDAMPAELMALQMVIEEPLKGGQP